jgi:hypothetical protein
VCVLFAMGIRDADSRFINHPVRTDAFNGDAGWVQFFVSVEELTGRDL